MDKHVAQYFSLYSWLFWTIVPAKHPHSGVWNKKKPAWWKKDSLGWMN